MASASSRPTPNAAIPDQAPLRGQTLLDWRRRQLQLGGAAADLDWLLDLLGGLPWSSLQHLMLSPERTVRLETPLEEIETLWRRHLRTCEPLQYLVGRCPWRDLELTVTPEVLIPRQETEGMVELALALVGPNLQGPALWADLGTGSGCLAAALARCWPSSFGLAVDLSEQALGVARGNLERLDLLDQVQLLQGSWWDPLKPHWGALELVVSNPPYIPEPVWNGLDPQVRDHEPKLALSSGSDGLDAIRLIAGQASSALAPGGWLLIEHHFDHSPAVQALLRDAGLENLQAHRDLEGKVRFASGQRPVPR